MKFFSEVGCGSNAFWLESFVLSEFVITGCVILTYAMDVASMGYFHGDSVRVATLVYESIVVLALCVHAYYLTIPIKAERSTKVDYNSWLSWSNYQKGLAAGSIFGAAVVLVTSFTMPDDWWTRCGRQVVFALCWLFSSRGILLLLTKNRYGEKVALQRGLANIEDAFNFNSQEGTILLNIPQGMESGKNDKKLKAEFLTVNIV